MIDNKLFHAINLYEAEREQLLRFIQNSITETEYQLAHFYQEALYQLDVKLRNLKTFEDEFYHEKSHTKFVIGNIERSLQTDQPTLPAIILTDITEKVRRESLLRRLDEMKAKLETLNQKPKKPEFQENYATVFDTTLHDLLNNKIHSFQFILIKKANLLLQFNYYRKKLKVTLPRVKTLCKNDVLDDEQDIIELMNLGFERDITGSNLILTLSGDTLNVESSIKRIVSIIVFEIVGGVEPGNESFIRIILKTKK